MKYLDAGRWQRCSFRDVMECGGNFDFGEKKSNEQRNERTRVRTAAACLEGRNAIHYIIRPMSGTSNLIVIPHSAANRALIMGSDTRYSRRATPWRGQSCWLLSSPWLSGWKKLLSRSWLSRLKWLPFKIDFDTRCCRILGTPLLGQNSCTPRIL